MKAKQIQSKIKPGKIKLLKDYFKKEPEVILAFLFGSQAKGREMKESDWDVGAYFKPKEYMELETEIDYPKRNKIWSDLVDILETDSVDFVVLNRARPSLVYHVLRTGIPLVIKDKKSYFDLLCKTSYEAMDWWQFVNEYWQIAEKAKSLTAEAKSKIKERLIFLKEQLQDLEKFKKMPFHVYEKDRSERRNIERWVENLVAASLDIAKIVLASEKREIPQSYKDILKVFTAIYINPSLAEKLSQFADLRNVVVHEYLDIKWKQIKDFVKAAEKIYPRFIRKVSQMTK